MEDALTLKDDEGGGVTALSFGEPSSRLWSGDIRMGKPNCVNRNYSPTLQSGEVYLAKWNISVPRGKEIE